MVVTPTAVQPKKRGPEPGQYNNMKKKTATLNKKKAPNKKAAAPNKKKAPNKTAMAMPRSNALSLPRGAKVSEIPFPQREGRNFDATMMIAFHLLFQKLKLGNN